MTYSKPLFITLLLINILSVTSGLKAQNCGTDAFLDKCAPSLGDYNFIKTFDVKTKKEASKTEVSYVLSKGSTYRLVVCDEDIKGNKMKVKLYDRNKKMIASNYLSSSGKYYPVINYKCSATGVYYVEASFKKGKVGCGVVILGFTK